MKIELPPGEFAEAFDLAVGELLAALGDPSAWAQEVARLDAPPLPWPPAPAKGEVQLMRELWRMAVKQVVYALRAQEFGAPEALTLQYAAFMDRLIDGLDPADDAVQTVLRIAHRAACAADVALRTHYGGATLADQHTGPNGFTNWAKRFAIEMGVRDGLSVAAAAKLVGISTGAAYRALTRKG